jgi:non-lysosomal glucosylceramidase
MQRLWNGEYFVQELPAGQRDAKWQYGDGCLADQLLGQWFADQLELGHLYPRDAVRTALQSIWRYNWAPDVGPQTAAHRPERDFAVAGEPGLFVCTWPKGAHRGAESVRYRDEVWTGIEYQFAAHLLREGFVTEGLSVVRGVHERSAPGKHNPYNEIECGDHYARALASWSCLLAVAGFAYDAAANTLSFAPRLSPDDFRCAFTAATAFGTIAQRRAGGDGGANVVEQWLTVRHGRMQAPVWRLEVPAGMRATAASRRPPPRDSVLLSERATALAFAQRDGRVEVQPPAGLALDVASPHYGVRVDFAPAK